MYNIEQIYTGCLAQGTYFITSKDEAIVIDPLREIEPYLKRATEQGVTIKYIFETHFHADFVSGHLDLAKATGAKIVYGPTAKPNFDAIIAEDNQVFTIGDISIKVLHTPGHTMESSCFLLSDEKNSPKALFSGDTLFIGDVGRPDLAQKATNMTQEELAGLLFHSLRDKVMVLPDEVMVYPAHGAGSACGKNMSDETSATIAHQKKYNYALREDMTKEEFIKEVTDGLLPPPSYFPENVAMNKMGYNSIEDIIKRGTTPLTVDEFLEKLSDENVFLLDTRNPNEFVQGYIPKSINIGLDGSFAPWVGALIRDIYQPIILITDGGREEEAVIRLSRVGYDNSIGYLNGGINAWKESGKEVEKITSITPEEFKNRIENENTKVVDVRRGSEYENGQIENALNLPLDYINVNMDEYPSKETLFFVHCAGGYRSVIACSILKANGFTQLINIQDGYKGIIQVGIKVVQNEIV